MLAALSPDLHLWSQGTMAVKQRYADLWLVAFHTAPPPGKPQLLVPLASLLPSQHTPTHTQTADSPGKYNLGRCLLHLHVLLGQCLVQCTSILRSCHLRRLSVVTSVGRSQAPCAWDFWRGKPLFPSVLVRTQTTQDLLSASSLKSLSVIEAPTFSSKLFQDMINLKIFVL